MYDNRTISVTTGTYRLAPRGRVVLCWVCMLLAFSSSVAFAWELAGPCDSVATHLCTEGEVFDTWEEYADLYWPSDVDFPSHASEIWEYLWINGGHPDYRTSGYFVSSDGARLFENSIYSPYTPGQIRRFVLTPIFSCDAGFTLIPSYWGGWNPQEWKLLEGWGGRVPVVSGYLGGLYLRQDTSVPIDYTSGSGGASNAYAMSWSLVECPVAVGLPLYPIWHSPRGQYLFVDLATFASIVGDYMPPILADDFDYFYRGPGKGKCLAFRSVFSDDYETKYYRKTLVRFRGASTNVVD